MTTGSDLARPGLSIPARRIPTPTTISPAAQAFLSSPPPTKLAPDGPLDDKDNWRAFIADMESQGLPAVDAALAAFPADIREHRLAGSTVYEIAPHALDSDTEGVILFVHGGAFIACGGMLAVLQALPIAHAARRRTFAIDYRMPPDHPFPVGLDDAVESYRWLLDRHDARRIAVVGISAGGGLAASLLLKARDLGLAMPGACVLATPELDLTESGDTFETNQYIDVVLRHRLTASIALYADGHDLTDPYLSPLFGDFSKGFPPTLLSSGTRDLFLSNTVRMHRALLHAGVAAELHVWEAMPHAGFFGAPEDGEVLATQADFMMRHGI